MGFAVARAAAKVRTFFPVLTKAPQSLSRASLQPLFKPFQGGSRALVTTQQQKSREWDDNVYGKRSLALCAFSVGAFVTQRLFESYDAANGFPGLSSENCKRLKACLDTCAKVNTTVTEYLLIVSLKDQKMHLINTEWDYQLATVPISASKLGAGQVEGSKQTPLGLHHIDEKIGDGATYNAIFKSRVDTGEKAIFDNLGERLIVGRIFWLAGDEPGVNSGEDAEGRVVDSKRRYIYIHGTNHIKELGTPASEGCITMNPIDMCRLFSLLPKGTKVFITKE